jgi:hypothetical protein
MTYRGDRRQGVVEIHHLWLSLAEARITRVPAAVYYTGIYKGVRRPEKSVPSEGSSFPFLGAKPLRRCALVCH